jgi:hypothetical protein
MGTRLESQWRCDCGAFHPAAASAHCLISDF